ncbi:hypothetical protein MAQ5080_03301 [Marinomonas aquimarina]|uniref:Uncharacterized protein n=1 Tax=Marinomonas aquimarina TaxID=295068 RepID=A0A1A8TNZ3_9GAMM|nr:hypothetical protein [Marinomonas aquimarina]SBS35890.1 hypothetical protein MAQ5080_03301 [Marinomonas aquimarina]
MNELQAQVLDQFECLIEHMKAVGYDDLVLDYQAPTELLADEGWVLPVIAFNADFLWATQLSQLISQTRDSFNTLNLSWCVTAHYIERGSMSWRLSISGPAYDNAQAFCNALRSDLSQLIADLGGSQSESFQYAEAV